MKRFDIISGSKFENMSQSEMSSVKGGAICISCMKRAKYTKRHKHVSGWKIVTHK